MSEKCCTFKAAFGDSGGTFRARFGESGDEFQTDFANTVVVKDKNSVRFIPQSLTDEQQAQARANIGVMDGYPDDYGFRAIKCDFFAGAFFGTVTRTVYIRGEFNPPGDDAPKDVRTKYQQAIALFVHGYVLNVKLLAKYCGVLAQNGIFGDNFLGLKNNSFSIMLENPWMKELHVKCLDVDTQRIRVEVRYAANTTNYATYRITDDVVEDTWSMTRPLTQQLNAKNSSAYVVDQHEMQKAPTKDMEVATKKYVDDTAKQTSIPKEDIQSAVAEYIAQNPITIKTASEESPGIVAVGANLKISETGALSVDTTDVAEEDNTKPITSSGVNTIVGNIGAILETI